MMMVVFYYFWLPYYYTTLSSPFRYFISLSSPLCPLWSRHPTS